MQRKIEIGRQGVIINRETETNRFTSRERETNTNRVYLERDRLREN